MNFTQLVLQARPNIKQNSAKAYATSLKLLAPEDATNLDFLSDTETVLGKLEKYKHTTRRNYLNAVIVVLKGVEGSEGPLQEYEKVRDKYNEEYAEQVQTHTKTERQKEIWIDWPDYLMIVEHLRENASYLKAETWTPAMKQTYQDDLITLLYSKYPLRNDWAEVKVISKTEYNALGEDEKKKGNYLVKHKSNKYFLFSMNTKRVRNTGKRTLRLMTRYSGRSADGCGRTAPDTSSSTVKGSPSTPTELQRS